MLSKKRHEGYLIIDHRASPGLPGVPRMLEAATYTCSHCQFVVVLNPERTRTRGYCPKCDHYICDKCEAIRAVSFECKPFKQIIEQAQEQAVKQS